MTDFSLSDSSLPFRSLGYSAKKSLRIFFFVLFQVSLYLCKNYLTQMNLLVQNTVPKGLFLTETRRQQSFISDEIAIISIYQSQYENISIPWSSITFFCHYRPHQCFIIFVPKYKQIKGKSKLPRRKLQFMYFREGTKNSLSYVT